MFVYRSEEKNEIIKQSSWRYGRGFEDVEQAIKNKKILDIIEHENQNKYPWQKVIIVEIEDYAWKVPCIENTKWLFLKTMYPSRKATAFYLPTKWQND